MPEVAAQIPESGTSTAWQSARYYGGSSFEFAEHLGVDDAGNAYLLARTFSSDMDAAIVPAARSAGEPPTATFVLKLGPDGSRLAAVTLATGFTFLPLDIAVGTDGSVHVLGRDGDRTHALKIDMTSGRAAYHATFDGAGGDERYPKAIAVDPAGDAVVAGWSPRGVFVGRLDSRGELYAVQTVAAAGLARDLTVDARGDIYVAGTIAGSDLVTTAGALQPQYAGGTCADPIPPLFGSPRTYPCADAFVVKLSRGAIAYATYFGGTGDDEATALTVDASGSVILTGLTRSADLPTMSPMQAQCRPGLVPAMCGDAFVARFDPDGRSLVFATYFGGEVSEAVTSVAVDSTGVIYVGGTVYGAGLPAARAIQPFPGGGRSDGFAAALTASGHLLWSTYVGGSDEERVVGVGVTRDLLYIAGETMSPGWAPGPAHHGARDLFSARIRRVP